MHRTFNHYLRNFVMVSAPFKSINLRVNSSECFYRKPLDVVNWLRIPADQNMRFFFPSHHKSVGFIARLRRSLLLSISFVRLSGYRSVIMSKLRTIWAQPMAGKLRPPLGRLFKIS